MAAMLEAYDLPRLRARNQVQPDPEVTELISDLAFAARWHAAEVARATRSDAPAPLVAQSLTVGHAAILSGISEAAVRKAISSRRLPARKVDGRWAIDRDDLDAFTPRRTPARENRMSAGAHFEVAAGRLISARDTIIAASDSPDPMADMVHGLSIVAGSMALLAEALESLTPTQRAHARAGLEFLRQNPDALPGEGSDHG